MEAVAEQDGSVCVCAENKKKKAVRVFTQLQTGCCALAPGFKIVKVFSTRCWMCGWKIISF